MCHRHISFKGSLLEIVIVRKEVMYYLQKNSQCRSLETEKHFFLLPELLLNFLGFCKQLRKLTRYVSII